MKLFQKKIKLELKYKITIQRKPKNLCFELSKDEAKQLVEQLADFDNALNGYSFSGDFKFINSTENKPVDPNTKKQNSYNIKENA